MIEYHNTYLEVLACSGLVGFFALVRFTLKLLGKIRGDSAFLPVVVAMYAYGLAGFGMRRLVYWGLIVMAYVICEARLREAAE